MVVVLYVCFGGIFEDLVRNDWERLREGRLLVCLVPGVDLVIWSALFRDGV